MNNLRDAKSIMWCKVSVNIDESLAAPTIWVQIVWPVEDNIRPVKEQIIFDR